MPHARAMVSACCKLVLLLAHPATGVHLTGWLPQGNLFTEYVGKFCYDYEPSGKAAGVLEISIEGQVAEGPEETGLYFFVYSDSSEHWAKAEKEWDQLTCDEMRKFASYSQSLNKVLKPPNVKYNKVVHVYEGLRPRFWFFTFAACGAATVTRPISYNLHAMNQRMGVQEEFGLDEEGTVRLQLGAALVFGLLAFFIRRGTKRAGHGEALRSRPILNFLWYSALFSTIGAFFRFVHYFVFERDGYGWGFFDVIGQMWVCGAKAMIVLLFLLTAKGWSLYYSKQEVLKRWGTVCTLIVLLLLSAMCEIHADWDLDWSPSLSQYESWSGTMILLLNMILFADGARSMHETYQEETSEEVKGFYMRVSGAASVYFLALPLLCVLSSMFRPWVRLKYVNRVEVFSRFLATLLLAICLRPSKLDGMINQRLEEGFSIDRARDHDAGERMVGDEDTEDTSALD